MFFFPFRADINLYKIPLLTVLISLLCNEAEVYAKAVGFCERSHTAAFQRALLRLSGTVDIDSCLDTLLKIHVSQDKQALVKELANGLGDTPGVAHADLRSYYLRGGPKRNLC